MREDQVVKKLTPPQLSPEEEASCKKVDPSTTSSEQTPGSIGNRELQYAEFQAASPSTGTWGKEFFGALEATMRDKLNTNGERVMAWVRRRSWGKYSLYCVLDDRSPAYAADCARELKLNPGTVSHILAFKESRGYLKRRGISKVIYPMMEPELGPEPEKVEHEAAYAAFIEGWKVANATTFEELEVAEATVKRIKKVVLAAWHKVQREQQNGGASLLPLTQPDSSDSSSSSSVVVEIPAATTTTVPASEFNPREELILAFVNGGRDSPTPKQADEALAALPSHPDAAREFIAGLRGRMDIIRSPGILKSAVEGFVAAWPLKLEELEKARKEKERADAIDRQIKERWKTDHPDLEREIAEIEAAYAAQLLQGTPAGVPPQAEHHQNPIALRKAKGA